MSRVDRESELGKFSGVSTRISGVLTPFRRQPGWVLRIPQLVRSVPSPSEDFCILPVSLSRFLQYRLFVLDPYQHLKGKALRGSQSREDFLAAFLSAVQGE